MRGRASTQSHQSLCCPDTRSTTVDKASHRKEEKWPYLIAALGGHKLYIDFYCESINNLTLRPLGLEPVMQQHLVILSTLFKSWTLGQNISTLGVTKGICDISARACIHYKNLCICEKFQNLVRWPKYSLRVSK